MHRWVYILFFFPALAFSEPIAEWASSNSLPVKYRNTIEEFKKIKCIPDKSIINVPVYNNSELFSATFGPEKSDCLLTTEWKVYGGVILASYDNPETVNSWYRKQLSGFSEFRIEQGNIFIKGSINKFNWNRDYPKYTNILIMPAKGGIKEGGYETIIELNKISF